MKFLKDIYDQQKLLEKTKDLSKLPPDVMKDIQKNIRDGAQDLEQNWANALELVHRAYLVAGVERPTPNLEDAWKQYEENIQYAVEQLANARGMDADWRMSSSMFHEALQEAQKKEKRFRVTVKTGTSRDTNIVRAESMEDLVERIKDKDTKLHDVNVQYPDNKTAVLRFSKYGIKKNMIIRIEQLRQL